MKTTLQLSLLVLLTLGVSQAQASLAVDPMAAALGSSSIFEPIEPELAIDPQLPEIRSNPAHWQGIRTSNVYLVRREGRSGVWFSRPGVSGSLQPITPGTGTVDVDTRRGGVLGDRDPRLHDPSHREWLGLDLRRGRQPVIVIPRGGGQPHTPTTPAPEPGTVMLLASGLGALGTAGFVRRRQARQG